MKEDSTQIAEDVKIYSEGLILAIKNGRIQESLEYVKKMRDHLSHVQNYLEMKKSIPEV